MTIAVGDKLPSTTIVKATENGPEQVSSDDFFAGRKVALVAVPGAFTPTCSARHLPGFLDKAEDIKAKGVDEIAFTSVNDAFVMGAWGNAQGAGDKIMMLADGNGEFTAQAGLELDLTGLGLGTRSQRYAAILQDGVVQELFVEPGRAVEASSADAILKAL